MELFDSDDEWVHDGLEELQASSSVSRPGQFNPRRDPELVTNAERYNARNVENYLVMLSAVI